MRPAPPVPASGLASLSQGGFTVCVCNAKGDNDKIINGYRHKEVDFSNHETRFTKISGQECTIPSTPGELFCVHVAYTDLAHGSRPNPRAGFTVYLMVDGTRATLGGWFCSAAKLKNARTRELEIDEFVLRETDGSYKKRQLRFGPRETTEVGPTYNESDSKLLGAVLVCVSWSFEAKSTYGEDEEEKEEEEEEEEVNDMLNRDECLDRLANPLAEQKAIELSVGVHYAPHTGEVVAKPADRIEVDPASNREYWFAFHRRDPGWLVAEGIADRSILPVTKCYKSPSLSPKVKKEETAAKLKSSSPLRQNPPRTSKSISCSKETKPYSRKG